ncbi:uncharacterized protein K452DRAFT_358394 [Aplosporella prunicola CBS 121167]|uniref:Uncharacterized protein n=1 Tax=Aplosporella prunicola CBS 121167 TaxID=1176127 RepID=A0A6A6BJB7_9PEZI|nr:uncharacterized protein K452DRAFT_358394 [Aplosporella prunicola CBS 121167]KAF2142661.1 hypothetical protein K452DRAFT_358394 [Aplosporella prunicola CBS 121167]
MAHPTPSHNNNHHDSVSSSPSSSTTSFTSCLDDTATITPQNPTQTHITHPNNPYHHPHSTPQSYPLPPTPTPKRTTPTSPTYDYTPLSASRSPLPTHPPHECPHAPALQTRLLAAARGLGLSLPVGAEGGVCVCVLLERVRGVRGVVGAVGAVGAAGVAGVAGVVVAGKVGAAGVVGNVGVAGGTEEEGTGLHHRAKGYGAAIVREGKALAASTGLVAKLPLPWWKKREKRDMKEAMTTKEEEEEWEEGEDSDTDADIVPRVSSSAASSSTSFPSNPNPPRERKHDHERLNDWELLPDTPSPDDVMSFSDEETETGLHQQHQQRQQLRR